MAELNPKQQIFIAQYLIDSNATRAAIAAGYSKKTAYSQGQRLLKHVEVAKTLNAKAEKRLARLEISAERVLEQLGRLAFFDVRSLFSEDGSLKPIGELSEEVAVAIAGLEHEKLFEHFAKGNAKHVGTTAKVKLTDRLRALELLGRHLKLFTDKVEVTGMDALATELEKARRRAQS